MKQLWAGGLAASLLLAAGVASAAPVMVGRDAFGQSTLVTFDDVTDQTQLADQYARFGLHFGSGPTYTDGSAPVRAVFGSQGAGNVLGGSPVATTITLLFDNPIIRLGFDQFSNGSKLFAETDDGYVEYGTGATARFSGLQDLGGFTSVVLYITAELDPIFRIDNLRFERAAVVSEPAGLALAGLALVAAAGSHRRRRGEAAAA